MNGFSSPSYFSCSSCSKELRFIYSNCNWITCSQCGFLTERNNLHESFPNKLPGEDASFIQAGTLGTWRKDKFEVTGRIQFTLADDSYVNWWHLAASNNSLWLAESYGSMRIMKEDVLVSPVSTLEVMKPGDKIKMADKGNFQLVSFSVALTWETEGELPYRPEEKKFMWIELSEENNSGYDVHIFDRSFAKGYLGEDVDREKISLTKIRNVNGWN